MKTPQQWLNEAVNRSIAGAPQPDAGDFIADVQCDALEAAAEIADTLLVGPVGKALGREIAGEIRRLKPGGTNEA